MMDFFACPLRRDLRAPDEDLDAFTVATGGVVDDCVLPAPDSLLPPPPPPRAVDLGAEEGAVLLPPPAGNGGRGCCRDLPPLAGVTVVVAAAVVVAFFGANLLSNASILALTLFVTQSFHKCQGICSFSLSFNNSIELKSSSVKPAAVNRPCSWNLRSTEARVREKNCLFCATDGSSFTSGSSSPAFEALAAAPLLLLSLLEA
mmetsp:Transcript_21579/g.34824  ORF Transcript_21579/g.34824 Transcript_21579/m.34824 type:complete len:203 (-) Transcript_21579:2661-3269(-)